MPLAVQQQQDQQGEGREGEDDSDEVDEEQTPSKAVAIQDCAVRFINCLPREELEKRMSMMFTFQEAYWWYKDMWCDKYPELPRLSMVAFGKELVEQSLALKSIYKTQKEVELLHDEWRRYVRLVPVRGGILLNDNMDKTVMVQGYKGSDWMWPRGKMIEGERDHDCAEREVEEEIGIRTSHLINPDQYIERLIDGQSVRLYIIPGVAEDTKFEPKCRKEIGKIRWIQLKDLPNWNVFQSGSVKQRFWAVKEFTRDLRDWVERRRRALSLSQQERAASRRPIKQTTMKEILATLQKPFDAPTHHRSPQPQQQHTDGASGPSPSRPMENGVAAPSSSSSSRPSPPHQSEHINRIMWMLENSTKRSGGTLRSLDDDFTSYYEDSLAAPPPPPPNAIPISRIESRGWGNDDHEDIGSPVNPHTAKPRIRNALNGSAAGAELFIGSGGDRPPSRGRNGDEDNLLSALADLRGGQPAASDSEGPVILPVPGRRQSAWGAGKAGGASPKESKKDKDGRSKKPGRDKDRELADREPPSRLTSQGSFKGFDDMAIVKGLSGRRQEIFGIIESTRPGKTRFNRAGAKAKARAGRAQQTQAHVSASRADGNDPTVLDGITILPRPDVAGRGGKGKKDKGGQGQANGVGVRGGSTATPKPSPVLGPLGEPSGVVGASAVGKGGAGLTSLLSQIGVSRDRISVGRVVSGDSEGNKPSTRTDSVEMRRGRDRLASDIPAAVAGSPSTNGNSASGSHLLSLVGGGAGGRAPDPLPFSSTSHTTTIPSPPPESTTKGSGSSTILDIIRQHHRQQSQQGKSGAPPVPPLPLQSSSHSLVQSQSGGVESDGGASGVSRRASADAGQNLLQVLKKGAVDRAATGGSSGEGRSRVVSSMSRQGSGSSEMSPPGAVAAEAAPGPPVVEALGSQQQQQQPPPQQVLSFSHPPRPVSPVRFPRAEMRAILDKWLKPAS
ncbi:unnamed protein product [Vitrella brassicaformis CCMP3155]|uniref:Nudix hydrolase domain-containing protein n=2 Tax=Vitrella brassicaformis TaxID=1169539 RepID=A0A0G4F7X7_VITBC|nr:unnamed protein product [Vitrella brassicaformis CCMP3155]|eukprot:CEM08653.1 unnamed protein product [Vitrella brassicaformis CCMP3155]